MVGGRLQQNFIKRVNKGRISLSSERIQELLVLLDFMRVNRSLAIGGNMVT